GGWGGGGGRGGGGMGGFGLFGGVDGERADGIRHAIMARARRGGALVTAHRRGLRGRHGRCCSKERFGAGHRWAKRGCSGEALARGRGESKNAGIWRARHSQGQR